MAQQRGWRSAWSSGTSIEEEPKVKVDKASFSNGYAYSGRQKVLDGSSFNLDR